MGKKRRWNRENSINPLCPPNRQSLRKPQSPTFQLNWILWKPLINLFSRSPLFIIVSVESNNSLQSRRGRNIRRISAARHTARQHSRYEDNVWIAASGATGFSADMGGKRAVAVLFLLSFLFQYRKESQAWKIHLRNYVTFEAAAGSEGNSKLFLSPTSLAFE